MKLDELIEDIMIVEGLDRKKILKILSEGIRSKLGEDCISENVYRAVYNNLTDKCCEEYISKLSNGEVAGPIWSLEDTNSIAKKLDINFNEKPYTPQEFRAYMTKEYYDHNIPLKKSGVEIGPITWGRMSDYYLSKHPKAMINEYFY